MRYYKLSDGELAELDPVTFQLIVKTQVLVYGKAYIVKNDDPAKLIIVDNFNLQIISL